MEVDHCAREGVGLDEYGHRAFPQRHGAGRIAAPHLIGAWEIKQEPER